MYIIYTENKPHTYIKKKYITKKLINNGRVLNIYII